ncbi:hypothetical protein NESM_000750200 [Novymonas esmeraldas]|uniref:Uncharacterized protein n=1 Tax=Novymonas esmeraldas TaxID=1808958 RepID=A0AAW0EVY5_9TRYP
MFRISGGMAALAGLMFANLVGFSMQNDAGAAGAVWERDVTVDADGALVRTLRQFTPIFVAGYIMYLYCSISVGVITRDMEAQELRSLKRYYGLR